MMVMHTEPLMYLQPRLEHKYMEQAIPQSVLRRSLFVSILHVSIFTLH